MICPKCNSQMPDGTVFCSACGSTMSSGATVDMGNAYGAPNPSKKGNDKKKIIMFAAIGVVVLALIITLISVIAANSTPEAKVMNAANKTGKQLEKMLASSDTLVEMTDNAEKLITKNAFTVNADISAGRDASVELSLSKDKNVLGASGTMKADGISFDFQLYADEKGVTAALPSDLDSAYSVTFKDFGTRFAESDLYEILEDNVDDELLDILEALEPDLFAEPTWKSFKKAYPEEAKAVEKAYEFKKSKESIPETSGKMTVYTLEVDMGTYIDALIAYSSYTTELTVGKAAFENMDDYVDQLEDKYEALEDVEAVLYFGISGGCLTAVHAELDVDGDDYEVTVVFEGDKNIWEEVVLYVDGEDVATLTIEDTGSGFEAELEVGDYEYAIECDDAAGELVILVEGEEMLTIEYSADDKGATLSCDLGEADYTISVLPLQKIEKIKDSKDILTMTEDEFEELAEEIEEIFN